MPELPDVELYLTALDKLLGNQRIDSVVVKSPFLLRTFDPDISICHDLNVFGFTRIGKRIVWNLSTNYYLVFHLMIAGRFHWKKKRTLPKGKNDLAAFHFEHGTMMLTEASTKKRASLHVIHGQDGLAQFDRGGLNVLECDFDEFKTVLLRKNHTLKRALTDPKIFDGIGNAYSDEILHKANLSPLKWTSRLDEQETVRLYEAVRSILASFTKLLHSQNRTGFPEKVTAFRPEMAAHGKYNEPCPICQTKIQRIIYANNETNYCPRCQTSGKLLADRSMSRLLKGDWPKSIDELEELDETR